MTSYFFIPVPYDERGISFFGVSSRRSCSSSQKSSTSASLVLVLRAKTWITVILNGLPWKQTEIILLFLRLHPSTELQTLDDFEGCSISSKGFLPTVADIMSDSAWVYKPGVQERSLLSREVFWSSHPRDI